MTRQTNFSAGELAPLYQGRSDLPVYGRGLKKMRNFFPSKHGAAVSRPGTLFVNTTKNPNDTQVRLLPFIYSDSQSYALEFGAGYIRFHTDGGTLQNPILAAPYEKTTDYQTAHLRGIRYMQVGDVLTLVRNSYAPMELRRLPDWTQPLLQALKTKADAEAQAAASQSSLDTGGQPDPVPVKAAFRRIFIAQDEAASEALGVLHGEDAYNAWLLLHPLDVVGALDAYQSNYYNFFEASLWDGAQGAPHWTFLPVSFARPAPHFGGTAGGYPTIDSGHLTAGDATHPDQVWKYAVTLTVKERDTGRQFETLPWFIGDSWDHNAANVPVVLADDLHSVYPDRHLIIYRGTHKNRPAANANTVDQSYQELGWNIYRGHDQRVMGLIGTAQGDTFVDVGNAPDYATQPPLGTNPFITYDYAGAVAQVETPAACCIFQDRKLFGGTQLRPVALFGSATGDYTNFDLHELVHAAGESIYFELAAMRGEKIAHLVPGRRALVATEACWRFFGGAGGAPLDFDSVDADIIDNVGAKEVAPLDIDGDVLFVRTKGSGARALRTDQGGNFRGVDISVQADHLMRGKGDFLPALGARKDIVEWTYAEDPWGLVWAVRDDGMLLAATYEGGSAGWCWHDSYTKNLVPGLFKSVCAVPETDEDAVYVVVRRALAVATPIAQGGNPWASVPDPQGFVLCIERMTSRVQNNDVEDDACVDCGLRFEGVPTAVLTGLEHLAGEDVWFVSKGNAPQGPITVDASGELALQDVPAANDGANVVGFVGLRYVPELETLNVTGKRMAQKGVPRVGLDVVGSSGLLVGRDFDHLDETPSNTVASGYAQPDPATELVVAEVQGLWDTGGRICIQQSKPLPVTVVGIDREVVAGG